MYDDVAARASRTLNAHEAQVHFDLEVTARDAVVDAPYVRAVGLLEGVQRWALRSGALVLLGSLLLNGYQGYRISSLASELRQKEYLVVPGATDFSAVRPNTIPDEVVLAFARFFIENMVSVSHRNIEDRQATMRRYMSPALETALDQELTATTAILKQVRGAEMFTSTRPPEVKRLTVDGGTVFEAKLRGVVERWALDKVLDPVEEVVTLTFKTRENLGPEEPWVFVATDFARRTSEEHAEYENALRRVAHAEGEEP